MICLAKECFDWCCKWTLRWQFFQKSSHSCCWEQQSHCPKTSQDLPIPRDKAKKPEHGLQESNGWPHTTLQAYLLPILPAPFTWCPLQPHETSSSSQNRSGSFTHSRLCICKGKCLLLEPMSLSYFWQGQPVCEDKAKTLYNGVSLVAQW